MLNKKLSSHHGLPRNKIIRAAGRKRLKSNFPKGGKPQVPQSPPNTRVDEDSGLGGDSFGADLSMDSSNQHTGSPTRRGASSSCSVSGGNTNSGYPGIILPEFGTSNQILVDGGIEICPKRLRLDMTEEANELPEEETPLPQQTEEGAGGGGRAKIVSFKNIPGLILPAVQVQPTTLLSIPARPSMQSQSKPRVVEHLKQKASTSLPKGVPRIEKGSSKKKGKGHVLEGNLPSVSSDGSYELQLLTQPELQHRARYQTEGSRGSVKDREGTGHPCVKLKGYEKNAVLQVFVASDGAQGSSVTPHLFYQACKVSGKNSTPCSEERIHGTTVLEILLQPEKEMTVSCDCVGILKERNVDVEQRMKSFVTRGKKKSTKCRLVFRTKVTLDNGAQEILQVVSQPISCTQPPGIPEICRKSRSSCNVDGNKDLFIIGRSFYKDTEVVFKEVSPHGEVLWSANVIPEKDYLQSNHLICQIPPYPKSGVIGEVEVQLVVVSCGKLSDPHSFTYLPSKKEKNQEQFVQQQRHAPPQQHHQIMTQLPSLSKGILPSTIKLGEIYTESGGNVPLSTVTTSVLAQKNNYSSKELVFFPNTLTSTSFPTVITQKQTSSSVTGEVKEERISSLPPLPSAHQQVTRVLATVIPQIQMITNPVPKFTQKALHSNTFTTATIHAPKPSPNSAPSHVLSVGSNNLVAPTEIKEKENVLENLIHMLKLLKSIPGNLHNPIVELVADEILRQVRKGSVRVESGAETLPQNVVEQVQELGNVNPHYIIPNINGKHTDVQKGNTVKNLTFAPNANGMQMSAAAQSPLLNQENPVSKIYPLNSTYVHCPEVRTVLPANSTTVAANEASTHAYLPLTIDESGMKNAQETNAKVVFPENSDVFQPRGILNDFHSATGSFHSGSNDNTMVHHAFTRQELNSNTAVMLPETSAASAKLEFATPMNVVASCKEQTSCNSSSGDILTTKLTQSENHLTSIYQSNYKVIHPLQTDNSSSSLEMDAKNMKIEESLLQKSTINNTVGINTPLQFKMENCDPLLSQANALTTMTSHTTEDQLSMTAIHAPLGSNLHSSEGTASSIIASTIGATNTTNEVPISSFSESELLDYINPTCFDNV